MEQLPVLGADLFEFGVYEDPPIIGLSNHGINNESYTGGENELMVRLCLDGHGLGWILTIYLVITIVVVQHVCCVCVVMRSGGFTTLIFKFNCVD